MNVLRGLGACAVLAGIAYTVTRVTQVSGVVIGYTAIAIVVSLTGWALSLRRLRHDRRVAGATRRRKRSGGARSILAGAAVLALLGGAGIAGYRWWTQEQDSAVLTVRYRTHGAADGGAAQPWLEVINTSGRTVDLADVRLRYYYTADGDAEYAANCTRTALDCSHVSLRTVPAGNTGSARDAYLEVGFTGAAGTLKPGGTTRAIGLQLYRVDHKKVDQSDDYSFDATMTVYQESARVTAYLDGVQVWGEGPDGDTEGTEVSAGSGAGTARIPEGVLFDDFAYTGPDDKALAAHNWEARDGEGGPGIKDSWSKKAVTFPSGESGASGQVVRLEAATDGTKKGTVQSEFHTVRPVFREGTLAARVYFGNTPVRGKDGDHVSPALFAISPDHKSKKYSELDFEYMPNGGWGRYGPILDTTSWRSSEDLDRVTEPHTRKLEGWHILTMTAVDDKVTYAVDGKKLYTSGKAYFPRESMTVNFSNWFVDLPFQGKRSWEVKVDWVYLKSGAAVPADEAAEAAAGLAAQGTPYVNTLPKKG
ncbi:cellulose binding domain-containing protein [Streptomyces sp. NPDC059524]|uniref:cellulose binding domain-containing protein n=1 Tax=Streptomyces sp. NPDC059524 TaxID=3346856 RepID=UPI0036C8F86A